jgi:membrane protein
MPFWLAPGFGGKLGADFAFPASMWRVIRETFAEFGRDECPRMAAALAFYAVFALPALLTFTVMVAAAVVDREQITSRLDSHLREAMGPVGARQILALLAQAQQPGKGLVAGLIGVAVLVVSATGALGELQTALNRAWRVEADPQRGGWWSFLWKRLVSLALLLGIAGLLLASLVASWGLAEFSAWTQPYLPDWMSGRTAWALNTLLSLTLVTVLIAVIFKYMPDVRLAWSDVLLGAAVTAVLFVLGKTALGLYFALATPTSAYGAAGSLALVLLWIYYSAQAILLGAEFTQVWARRRGRIVQPEPGAKRAPPNATSSAVPASAARTAP